MIQDKCLLFFYLQLKKVLDLHHLLAPEHLLKALRHSALVQLMAHINKPVIIIIINKPLAKDQLLDIDKSGASSPAFVCLDDKEKRASNTRFAVSFSSYIT